MTPQDVLKQNIEFGHRVIQSYLSDLSDADLRVRPVPGANHAAWQLGHLIASNHRMLTGLGQPAPTLPEGFEAAHSHDTASCDDPACFATKARYLALAEQLKDASLAAVAATADRLDEPGPEMMRAYAPTVGAVLGLLGSHWLMHAGQFVITRRKLGKPVLF
jgi:hypothetical protein